LSRSLAPVSAPPVVPPVVPPVTPTLPPLVAPALLAGARRILFVTHLAIGDFTYLQSCLRAFAAAWPHIEIHLWVDERRRTKDPAAWPHLQKYALFDWLAACPWIAKVYDRTYSPATLAASLQEARARDYPLVATLTVVDGHRYARMARSISPRGFIVGLRQPAERWFKGLSRHTSYAKLNATIPLYRAGDCGGRHISDIYAEWFARFFGLEIPRAARFPVLDMPREWSLRAQAQIAAWGFGAARPIVFVNAFSKSPDRTWPLEHVAALIRAMQARPAWRDAGFIVNTVPEEMAEAQRRFRRRNDPAFDGVRLFSADEHFFQLPAVMGLCSLVISVETAVMHLANAVKVPVIALMRCTTPEWVPIDADNSTVVMLADRDDWVTAIGVDDVLAVLDRQPERVLKRLPAA
jgi:heptosyltransferase-3